MDDTQVMASARDIQRLLDRCAVSEDRAAKLAAALRSLVGESWHRGLAVGLTQANVEAARAALAGLPGPEATK